MIIDAWKGLPGGLTKAFMKTVGSIGVCKMLQSFKGAERSARAKAIIGFHYKDMVHIFEGSVSGTIALEPRGEYGFGWDNIFIPSGETKTYAELGSESKDKILMRQKAATDFAKNLQDCLT